MSPTVENRCLPDAFKHTIDAPCNLTSKDVITARHAFRHHAYKRFRLRAPDSRLQTPVSRQRQVPDRIVRTSLNTLGKEIIPQDTHSTAKWKVFIGWSHFVPHHTTSPFHNTKKPIVESNPEPFQKLIHHFSSTFISTRSSTARHAPARGQATRGRATRGRTTRSRGNAPGQDPNPSDSPPLPPAPSIDRQLVERQELQARLVAADAAIEQSNAAAAEAAARIARAAAEARAAKATCATQSTSVPQPVPSQQPAPSQQPMPFQQPMRPLDTSDNQHGNPMANNDTSLGEQIPALIREIARDLGSVAAEALTSGFFNAGTISSRAISRINAGICSPSDVSLLVIDVSRDRIGCENGIGCWDGAGCGTDVDCVAHVASAALASPRRHSPISGRPTRGSRVPN
ncbi:hypothetical protein E4U40_003543 [Claviceps sp. LM458 group G5]|nr:hypothetical protein E4U40_003543 [Claviceps sp. LM458 group G5]